LIGKKLSEHYGAVTNNDEEAIFFGAILTALLKMTAFGSKERPLENNDSYGVAPESADVLALVLAVAAPEELQDAIEARLNEVQRFTARLIAVLARDAIVGPLGIIPVNELLRRMHAALRAGVDCPAPHTDMDEEEFNDRVREVFFRAMDRLDAIDMTNAPGGAA
jgi:hypothetical protein